MHAFANVVLSVVPLAVLLVFSVFVLIMLDEVCRHLYKMSRSRRRRRGRPEGDE